MGFVDVLPFIIMSLSFICSYLLSQGKLKPVYIITIIGCTLNIICNILYLQVMEGKHTSILLFNLGASWAIIMAIRGLRRLHKLKAKND